MAITEVTLADIPQDKVKPGKQGRPRQSETTNGVHDEASLRKERTRLAQRMYRERKDKELNAVRARVVQVETALDKVLASFAKFHTFAITGGIDLPAGFALELSRTALEITTLSQEARKELVAVPEPQEQDENAIATTPPLKTLAGDIIGQNTTAAKHLTYEENLQSWHSPLHTEILKRSEDMYLNQYSSTAISYQPTFARILFRACVERGFRLLHSIGTHKKYNAIHPALTVPLTTRSVTQILDSIDHVIGVINGRYPTASNPATTYPKAYRLVEGSTDTLVPRKQAQPLQQLAFGKTRTKVDLALPEIQGEWLEPEDVREYLEVRGIFVDDILPKTEVTLMMPGPMLESSRDSLPFTTHHKEQNLPNPQLWDAQNSNVDYVFPPDYMGNMNEATWENGAESFSHGLSNHFNLQTHNSDHLSSPHTQGQYISITVNLVKLVENLANRAVCLGSGPGLRRSDVDSALRDSISAA